MRVHKYTLSVAAINEIQMPQDAAIVKAGLQNEVICLWAMVDINKPLVTRKFQIEGTGFEFQAEGLRYLDSVLMHGGVYVFHIFEVM